MRPSQGSSAELAWENTKAFPYVPTLIFDKGKLLGVTDKGFLLVHDAATGKELVNRRLGAGYSASPLLVDGVLITVDEKGSVSCVGTGEGFPVLGKTELGEAVIATPGGLVSDPDNFQHLLASCLTVWLQATPEDHMGRVLAQGDTRPMAANPEAMDDLRRILQGRAAFYAKADLALDTSAQDLEQTFKLLRMQVRQALRMAPTPQTA